MTINNNKSIKTLLPALKRLLAYGKTYRKPMTLGVVMLWVAAIAEVGGPLLISYFIFCYLHYCVCFCDGMVGQCANVYGNCGHRDVWHYRVVFN